MTYVGLSCWRCCKWNEKQYLPMTKSTGLVRSCSQSLPVDGSGFWRVRETVGGDTVVDWASNGRYVGVSILDHGERFDAMMLIMWMDRVPESAQRKLITHPNIGVRV